MPSAPTVFVDTNVLVYADDGREPAKRDQARVWLARLWAERRGRTSNQVLNEYYAVATRKLASQVTRGDARAEVRRYQHWNPWSTAGLHQGCEMLLTEDLQHDQRIDNLRIVNPFRVGPELLDEPA